MAVTLATIRSLVRANLDETTAADWTDSNLNSLINMRYHQVYTAVVNVFEDYNITKVQINTVANQQEYGTTDSLPSDIYKVRRVEINYDTSTNPANVLRALPITNIDEVRGNLGNNNLGVGIFSNPGYYDLGSKIGFIPIPSKAGTNAITVWYIKNLADLTSDSSTIDIPYPERYYRAIVDGALADALHFGQQDPIEADKFEAKFTAEVLLMQTELEERIAEETKTVIDTSGEDIDFGGLSY